MSDMVVLYQFAIVASVLIAQTVLGEKASFGVAAGWALWTLVLAFGHTLYAAQLLTIGAAVWLALHLKGRKAVIEALVACGVVAGIGLYFAQRSPTEPLRTANPVPAARAAVAVTPAAAAASLSPAPATSAASAPAPIAAVSAASAAAEPEPAAASAPSSPAASRPGRTVALPAPTEDPEPYRPRKVAPEPSPCMYKGVMSDADYLACGITPPRR